VAKAQTYFDDGDLRFAAELLNHVVFAEPDHAAAKALLADTYDQLGWGAENGTWRNFYLMGAYELRHGIQVAALDSAGSVDMVSALSVEQLFDSIAIRIDGPRAWDTELAIDWHFTDLGDGGQTIRTLMSNGVLIQDVDPDEAEGPADLTLTLTKAQLLGALAGAGLDGVEQSGDPATLSRLMALVDPQAADFAIVTPML
jgi:alkyl sulfatase BDS1-like metallo-beta-lactamase superfamily hydrolase